MPSSSLVEFEVDVEAGFEVEFGVEVLRPRVQVKVGVELFGQDFYFYGWV